MKQKIIRYLQIAFPFLLTIVLWRLSCPWVNPAGLLCIIPIFYCSFIKPVCYFAPFALVMCFLLDYKFGSDFMWTIYYCLCYMIMNLQTAIDLTHTKKSGVYAFMTFGNYYLIYIFATHRFYKFITFGYYVCNYKCVIYSNNCDYSGGAK